LVGGEDDGRAVRVLRICSDDELRPRLLREFGCLVLVEHRVAASDEILAFGTEDLEQDRDVVALRRGDERVGRRLRRPERPLLRGRRRWRRRESGDGEETRAEGHSESLHRRPPPPRPPPPRIPPPPPPLPPKLQDPRALLARLRLPLYPPE